jgi:hypothetical protein
VSNLYRSKTIATWLAIIGGTLGLHRLYLRGFGNVPAWLHLLPTGLGLIGALRMREIGQDDKLAWLLIPILGLMIAQAMLHAIVYGLTPDEKWDARHNPGAAPQATRWGPILGVIAALLIGATVLMGTIAFSGQKIFESMLEAKDVPQPAQPNSQTPK